MEEIKAPSEFENWLETHDYFEDGRWLKCDFFSDRIKICLAQIARASGWSVGEEVEFKVYEFEFKAANSSQLIPQLPVNIDGVDSILELDSGIGLAIDIDMSTQFKVLANSVFVSESTDFSERIQPQVSDWKIFATILGVPFPTPEDWINRLQNEGIEAAWRVDGQLKIKPTSEMPTQNYDGYYLVESKRLLQSRRGVFFFACTKMDNGFRVSIERQDDDPKVWQALKFIVGKLGKATIAAGNCEFSGPEWIEYLKDGKLPSRYLTN